jgi:hypothetical protein
MIEHAPSLGAPYQAAESNTNDQSREVSGSALKRALETIASLSERLRLARVEGQNAPVSNVLRGNVTQADATDGGRVVSVRPWPRIVSSVPWRPRRKFDKSAAIAEVAYPEVSSGGLNDQDRAILAHRCVCVCVCVCVCA